MDHNEQPTLIEIMDKLKKLKKMIKKINCNIEKLIHLDISASMELINISNWINQNKFIF
jgi:hypothetical protein